MTKSCVSAIFTREFNYTPKGLGLSWRIKPSPEPQTFPRHVIAAAREAGAAKPVQRRKPAKQ